MPRQRVEKIVSDDGTTKVVESEVETLGETKVAQWSVPSNAEAFRTLVANASATADDGKESQLDYLYRLHCGAVARNAMAAVREVAATTIIVIPGIGRKDVMEFPAANIIAAANGLRGLRTMKLMALGILPGMDVPADKAADVETIERGLTNYSQFQEAVRRLVESGKATDTNGVAAVVA